MARENTGGRELVRLSDSDFRLEEPWNDVRGSDVYAAGGEKVGTVEDLYVDTEERKVRFLTMDSGGFLGTSIGQTHRMVPVEAIGKVDEGQVTLNQDEEKVAGSPPFDTNVVPKYDLQRETRDYYGY